MRTSQEYEQIIKNLVGQVENAVILAFRNNGMTVDCVESDLEKCKTCPLVPCAFREMLDNAEKSTGKNLLPEIKRVMQHWKHSNGGYCSPYSDCDMFRRVKSLELTIEIIFGCASDKYEDMRAKKEEEKLLKIREIAESAISRFKEFEILKLERTPNPERN
jgi:hypothetical protein